MKTTHPSLVFLSVLITMFLFACGPKPQKVDPAVVIDTAAEPAESVTVEFTLRTIAENGKLLFVGVGGDIDGILNPDLLVPRDAAVRIILINGDSMPHDLFLPDFNAKTEYVKRMGEQAEIIFKVSDVQPGTFVYYCTVPGHRKAGQEGKLIVESSEP